jgi:hypothetical protein
MASKIVPGNINGTYPTAGENNSSQGFRDNFTAIKNNFTEAQSEINDLDSNKANLNAANDFAGNTITDAELKDNSETVFAHGSIADTITLNHENGHYQTLTTTDTITLAFLNFPTTGKLGRIILDVTVASTAHTITIPSNVLVSSNLSGGDGSSDTITVPTSGRYLYEFMSPDGGTTILMHQLGNNYI